MTPESWLGGDVKGVWLVYLRNGIGIVTLPPRTTLSHDYPPNIGEYF